MTRQFQISAAPHTPPSTSVAAVMLHVLVALVPGIVAAAWLFGPGVLIQIVLAVVFALVFESLMLKARRRPLKPFINDYSAVVTAVLFAVCIPPLAPWWITCIGMLFAIVFAKHLYGGLGNNIFNPAMVAYVVVLISFPQAMTAWLAPLPLADVHLSLAETLASIFNGKPGPGWDAVTAATPLDLMKNGLEAGQTVVQIRQSAVFGTLGGIGWEWMAVWFGLGGAYLLFKRVIHWHVPVSLIASVILFSLLFWLFDTETNPSPLSDVFSGAVILAAFFIATDPVSGCTSNRGRLIFGAGVGLISLVIRRWGAYPDGIAFAVLLMNMAAPLIDRYTRPRTDGE